MKKGYISHSKLGCKHGLRGMFFYSIWYYFIAKYAKITSQMFPVWLNRCLNKSQNIVSVN